MAFWSASTSGLHASRVLPSPLTIEKHPDSWPATVGRYWLQAKRSLSAENWDAAALTARSALQAALRDQQATGKSLKNEIDDLATKGLLPPIMKDWAHNLRELGNDSAHPDPTSCGAAPRDARDIVYFLDYLLEYLYTLPKRIDEYRARNQPPNSGQ